MNVMPILLMFPTRSAPDLTCSHLCRYGNGRLRYSNGYEECCLANLGSLILLPRYIYILPTIWPDKNGNINKYKIGGKDFSYANGQEDQMFNRLE